MQHIKQTKIDQEIQVALLSLIQNSYKYETDLVGVGGGCEMRK
jgi:hypothetical protein